MASSTRIAIDPFRIRQHTQIPYRKMIFFDYSVQNARLASRLGIAGVAVAAGVNLSALFCALRAYQNAQLRRRNRTDSD